MTATTATTTGTEIGETTGAAVGEAAGLGVMDVLGPIGILATIGTVIYSLVSGLKHHDEPPPLNPSVQFGT